MTRRFVSSGSSYEERFGYSRAVVDGKWVFVSGTIGVDFATGVMPKGAAAQTHQAIDTIEKALAAGEATIEDIVRVRAFVPDPADVEEVQMAIRDRIGPSRAANTTICSPLPVAGARVEIEVTARKGEMRRGPVHTASEMVRASPQAAFAFLADGLSLGRWALGCFGTKAAGDDLFVGHSLFDGKALFVRIEGNPSELAVTYHVGPAPDRLVPRITARVAGREPQGSGGQECRVSLIAERAPDMAPERWRHLTVTHETEILLIKAQIEQPGQ
jgi:enamine deaminase RidA (YjgF/YER057c/UK114 family)